MTYTSKLFAALHNPSFSQEFKAAAITFDKLDPVVAAHEAEALEGLMRFRREEIRHKELHP